MQIVYFFVRAYYIYVCVCAPICAWGGRTEILRRRTRTHGVVSTWSKHSRAAHGLNFALILNFLRSTRGLSPIIPGVLFRLPFVSHTKEKEKGKEKKITLIYII